SEEVITPRWNGLFQLKSLAIRGSAPPMTPVSYPKRSPPSPANAAALRTYLLRVRESDIVDSVATADIDPPRALPAEVSPPIVRSLFLPIIRSSCPSVNVLAQSPQFHRPTLVSRSG